MTYYARPQTHGAGLFEDRTGDGLTLVFSWSLGWKWLLPTPAAGGTWRLCGAAATPSGHTGFLQKAWPTAGSPYTGRTKASAAPTRRLAKNSNPYSTKCTCLKRELVIWICMQAEQLPAPAPLIISTIEVTGMGMWNPSTSRPCALQRGFICSGNCEVKRCELRVPLWALGNPWNSMHTLYLYRYVHLSRKRGLN